MTKKIARASSLLKGIYVKPFNFAEKKDLN
jgi:hypothetical protein